MYNEHVTRGMHKVQSKEKNSVACLNRPPYLAVFDLRVVKAVGEENPPELRDAVGVRLVVQTILKPTVLAGEHCFKRKKYTKTEDFGRI